MPLNQTPKDTTTTGHPPPATNKAWAGSIFFAGVIVWFINWVFSDGTTIWGSSALKLVLDVLSLLALIPLAYLLYRATSWVMERLLWRVRRRLVVTYLLIGLLPAVLLIALVGLIGYVVILESQVRLVQKQLANRLTEAQAITVSLADELKGVPASELPQRLEALRKAWQPLFPALEIQMLSAEIVPRWMTEAEDHHGWVMRNVTTNQREGQREVMGVHVKRMSRANWLQLRYRVEGLGEQLSRATGLQVSAGHASLELVRNPNGEAQLTANPSHPIEGLPIFVPMRDWETGRVLEGEALHLAPDFLLPANLWQGFNRFRRETLIGNVLVWTIGGIAVIFAVIAGIAVTAAMVLTRSVTNAVYYLYEGTQRVEAGDLQHEIRVTGRDQLGDLGHSFNRMIRSLRELLRVSAEKERLDQEMAIAASVQSRLFPRTMPQCDSLDLAAGVCQPARTVSGDYFDYFEIRPGLIAFVVADVCGKGVSAALLMSNLQAHLRSRALSSPDEPRDLRALVSHVNQRMIEASPDSSYVTMFYAEYDEGSSTLRYVNAGHNPPLLWQGTEMNRLDIGGTVVGLFRDSAYEEATLQLASGDLFVAFTDGLLEARNPAGEELGEDRLADWLRAGRDNAAEAIKQSVLRQVTDWTNQAEQEDDLTLLVWRRL